jgi:hypothetical protein
MKRNKSGALISVKSKDKISGYCYCRFCHDTFKPTQSRDCFALEATKDSHGEMVLQCETCLDKIWTGKGAKIIDLSKHPLTKETLKDIKDLMDE